MGLALNALEKFFWNFCDNYIEIVKHRLYRPEEFGDVPRYSAQKTIYTLLFKFIQNFSIFFPFITEEIYQSLYHQEQSIHLTNIKKFDFNFANEIKYGDEIMAIISELRGIKTTNNVSLKTSIVELDLGLNSNLKEAINQALKDFKATLYIQNLKLNATDSKYQILSVILESAKDNDLN